MKDAAFHRRWSRDTAAQMPVLERHAMKLHHLGPRVMLEFALELGAAHDIMPDVADRLARYAALTPRMIRLAGADRMVPRQLALVSSK